jgi:hypothetical protein
VAGKHTDVRELADRLTTAHAATVNWLTTVLAEEALGGPAALRRTPLQATAGTAIKLFNLPMSWSAQSVDRAVDALRSAGPAVEELRRAQRASEVTLKALSASRDAALQRAEEVTREEGAGQTADALHAARSAGGVLDASELPIPEYDELTVADAVAAVKELTDPGDIRAIVAYEELHKNRARIVSAAQTRLAGIAKKIVGINT